MSIGIDMYQLTPDLLMVPVTLNNKTPAVMAILPEAVSKSLQFKKEEVLDVADARALVLAEISSPSYAALVQYYGLNKTFQNNPSQAVQAYPVEHVPVNERTAKKLMLN